MAEALGTDSSNSNINSYRAGSVCAVVSHCPDASWSLRCLKGKLWVTNSLKAADALLSCTVFLLCQKQLNNSH